LSHGASASCFHYRDTRKIDPSKGSHLDDGLANDNDRMEIGPTLLAYGEWEAAGLRLPNLERMRGYRLQRLWNTHNPFRAAMVCADGYMVIWDYKNAPFLSEFNPLVRERRSGASMFYFATGDKTQAAASGFAAQVDDLLRDGGGNRRIAVDKIWRWQPAHSRRQDHDLGPACIGSGRV